MKIDILLGQTVMAGLTIFIVLYGLQQFTTLDFSNFINFPKSNVMALLGAALILLSALVGWRKRQAKNAD